MSDRLLNGRKFITILPGNYHATNRTEGLSTLLGSCVAACLYDPANRIIGMNHFLLSGAHNPHNLPLLMTESGRYGVHAMELLINAMLKLGASRQTLRAKVFGGATIIECVDAANPGVGKLNCLFIHNFLQTENIPLVAQDLGGTHGRVIYFLPEDYSVLVRRIGKTDVRRINQRERRIIAKQPPEDPSN